MKKILIIVLGGGGHTAQIIRLVNNLGFKYKYEYIVAKEDEISKDKVIIKGKVNFITPNHKKIISGQNNFIRYLKLTRAFYEAFLLIKNSNALAIITCGGSGISLPVSIVGKMLNKKIIYIESWSKVYSKTLTGRLIYFIADLFFVQWKIMKKLYPKAIYAGRLS